MATKIMFVTNAEQTAAAIKQLAAAQSIVVTQNDRLKVQNGQVASSFTILEGKVNKLTAAFIKLRVAMGGVGNMRMPTVPGIPGGGGALPGVSGLGIGGVAGIGVSAGIGQRLLGYRPPQQPTTSYQPRLSGPRVPRLAGPSMTGGAVNLGSMVSVRSGGKMIQMPIDEALGLTPGTFNPGPGMPPGFSIGSAPSAGFGPSALLRRGLLGTRRFLGGPGKFLTKPIPYTGISTGVQQALGGGLEAASRIGGPFGELFGKMATAVKAANPALLALGAGAVVAAGAFIALNAHSKRAMETMGKRIEAEQKYLGHIKNASQAAEALAAKSAESTDPARRRAAFLAGGSAAAERFRSKYGERLGKLGIKSSAGIVEVAGMAQGLAGGGGIAEELVISTIEQIRKTTGKSAEEAAKMVDIGRLKRFRKFSPEKQKQELDKFREQLVKKAVTAEFGGILTTKEIKQRLANVQVFGDRDIEERDRLRGIVGLEQLQLSKDMERIIPGINAEAGQFRRSRFENQRMLMADFFDKLTEISTARLQIAQEEHSYVASIKTLFSWTGLTESELARANRINKAEAEGSGLE